MLYKLSLFTLPNVPLAIDALLVLLLLRCFLVSATFYPNACIIFASILLGRLILNLLYKLCGVKKVCELSCNCDDDCLRKKAACTRWMQNHQNTRYTPKLKFSKLRKLKYEFQIISKYFVSWVKYFFDCLLEFAIWSAFQRLIILVRLKFIPVGV